MSETLELYEKLKYAREILAKEVKLGPSVLIGAVPLWIVAKRQPTSREGYLKIKGVTPQNLNLFFEGFDAVIHSHQTGRDLPKLWRFLDTIYLREEDKRQASAEAKKARIAEEKRRAKEVKRVTLAEEEKRKAGPSSHSPTHYCDPRNYNMLQYFRCYFGCYSMTQQATANAT